ncbi:MAG: efflux RND transporter periplasmic adaptor subunit [Myxococcales bacterium]|nr:efflux RND transporter periplasmic adaptor subunit [Myxococcales bacterium]
MKPMSSTPAPLRIARRIAPILAVVAVVVGGSLAWHHYRNQPATVTYTTTAVERGAVRQLVTASGTLSPVLRSTVGSQVSGRITEILVDFNDHVTRGQVLARLDKQLLQGQVAQARARLASARAELTRAQVTAASAKVTYDRAAGLISSGAIAAADVDAAKAARDTAAASIVAAKASIVEAQASLAAAQVNLEYTTITAPIDGVIISRSVDAGQTVAASLQAPELFVIAGDLAKMELHAAVAEADVGQLADGMTVELAFDAYPERTFVGAVRQVRNQATTTSNVVTYDAVVAVDNADGALRPGMTATATFVVASSDGLVVAAKALKYRPAGAPPPPGRARSSEGRRPADTRPAADTPAADTPATDTPATDTPATDTPATDKPATDRPRTPRAAVWVLRAGVPVRVPVTAGLTDGTTTVVTGPDLKDGDLVITADSSSRSGAASARGASARGGAGGRRGAPPPLL